MLAWKQFLQVEFFVWQFLLRAIRVFEKISEFLTTKPQFLGILPAALVIAALIVPRFANSNFDRIEKLGSRIARRKRACILSIAAAAVVIRLAFLILIPVPVPEVHDEFSYLLAGDTFAHGRLTNPPHALWVYLDTFHVNQHPTYMSKYPPGQGAVLAFGQWLGQPWIGVLLSMGILCGSVLWALQGWLPPAWALLGGVLCLFRLVISSYWVNSYWGGAVAAIGGALVIGALPRLVRALETRDALILAVGASILANSRPFEGLIFCLPVAGFLIFALLRNGSSPRSLWRIGTAIGSILLACGLFMAYYNWRLTNHPLLFPYSLNNQTYLSTPSLVWQKLEPPRHYSNPQFESYYNDGFSRTAWREGRADSVKNAFSILGHDAKVFTHFFLWPELCLPLIAIPWILFERRTRFLLIQTVFCFGGFLLVTWLLLPHYAAPLTATTFALVIQGIRHIRRWSFRGRVFGIGLTRAVVLSTILLCPFDLYLVRLHPALDDRARIATHLRSFPGKQLVLVRYLPTRPYEGDWVYNGADIDRADVVWARETPGMSMAPLLDYFRGRTVWEIVPGPPETIVSRYMPSH